MLHHLPGATMHDANLVNYNLHHQEDGNEVCCCKLCVQILRAVTEVTTYVIAWMSELFGLPQALNHKVSYFALKIIQSNV